MNRRNLIRLFLAFILLPLVHPVQSTPDSERLDKLLSGITTLESTFKQVLLDEFDKPIQESSGIFQLRRPGKFRWDYTKPYIQLIVADGQKLWVYDADLEQVTVKNQKTALGNTPALLLTGGSPVEKDFSIESRGSQEGVEWFELKPLDKESSFTKIAIGFRDNILHRMELTDSFGQTTRLMFDKIKINTTIPAKQFEFTPPKGVDVVKD